jgi:hypothetical protein
MTAAVSTEPGIPRDLRPFRLVLTEPAWAVGCRALLMDDAAWMVGALAWNGTLAARELLAGDLRVVRERPSGQGRPLLADWIAVGTAGGDGPLNLHAVHDFARSLEPRGGQLLAAVLIDRRDRRRWEAALVRGGACEPIEEVRIVGPGMLRLARRAEAASETPADLVRSSRTIGAMGAHVHRRLRESSVTLIGAGRNGSALVFELAALGVGRLRLVDPDVLRLENLDAMPGLAVGDVGRTKVEALAARLQAFRPDLSLSLVPRAVNAPGVQEFLRERTDLLVTCVDNDTPRLAAALTALRTLTVHLDVGTSVQRGADGGTNITGDARLLLPREGCAACVGGIADLDEAAYELALPPGSLPHRIRPVWSAERAGSLVTINAMTVGAAVQMWLDLLGGTLRTSLWQRFAWLPGQGLRSDAAPVGAAPDCRYCRRPA